MGDYKSGYATNVVKIKKITEKNNALKKKSKGSIKREQMYSANWKSVGINEVVEKFAPNSKPYTNGNKLIFPGNRYSVVCDTIGGYLRVFDNVYKTYVTLDGQLMSSLKGGKNLQLLKTHFKIKKRGEK